MSRSDLSPSPAAVALPQDLAAAAQTALDDWRAAFDEQLDVLERALQGSGNPGELSAIMIEFARIAGEEADAAAKQATLEAHAGARQAALDDARGVQASADGFRREADDLRRGLAAAREQLIAAQRAETALRDTADAVRVAHDETRRAHDELRHTHDELRSAHEQLRAAHDGSQRVEQELRHALEQALRAADAARNTSEEATRAADEARSEAASAAAARDAAKRAHTEASARETETAQAYRELREVHEALALQLQQLRGEHRTAESRIVDLEARHAGAVREAATQARDLQEFQQRLEAAVQDAEERSRARVRERARLELDVTEARAAASVAAVERDAAQDRIAHLTDELAALRTALTTATATAPARETEARSERTSATPAVHIFDTSLQWTTAEDGPTAGAACASERPPAARSMELATGGTLHKPAVSCGDASSLDGGDEPLEDDMKPANFDPIVEQKAAGPKPIDGAREDEAAEVLALNGEDGDEQEEEPTVADELVAHPDADGAFSTVADALRAWTIEPDRHVSWPPQGAPITPAPVAGPSSARSAGAPGLGAAHRVSVRHDLTGRHVSVTINYELGQVVDLSTGGAQVITTAMLVPGQPVRLTFPSIGPLATAKARIVWSRVEPPTQGGGELQYRAGLAFTAIDPRTVDRILNPMTGAAGNLR